MYVLCETKDGAEVSDELREELLIQFGVGRWFKSIHPLSLRSTNAVYVLQPHLPTGCLEIPTTALTTVAPPAALLFNPAAAVSPVSPAVAVNLQRFPESLLLECLSFCDANSLLFGVLPAIRSLPAVSAALASSTVGRRVLLSRLGAVSDAALWSEQLLREWRREGFEQQKVTASRQIG